MAFVAGTLVGGEPEPGWVTMLAWGYVVYTLAGGVVGFILASLTIKLFGPKKAG